MASVVPQCQALRAPDKQRCTEEATHANQLFCLLHSRQAHGLYVGYKRRNAKLEYLDKNTPKYLSETDLPLANDDFSAVNDEETIQDVINHLLTKYNTLNRVIEARKQHHTRFYSISYDYGHQVYIDKLVSQRHITLGALERARKRFLAIHYENEQWYSWVKHAQDEQEENREKEQKKIKQEAALFQRHMKQLEARLELMRRKEEKKLQDAFLDEAYKERMAQNDDNADEAAWDPIEDMEEDKRNQYIDLIKHFLWMPIDLKEMDSTTHDVSSSTPSADVASTSVTASKLEASTSSAPANTLKAKKKKAKSGSKKTSSLEDGLMGQLKLLAMAKRAESSQELELKEPDKNNIETEEEMRKRLSEGVKKNLENLSGMQIVGTMENPHNTWDRTAPIPEDEIDTIIQDIREVKLYLFCRLILSQASLLPAALKAKNVQEFLDDNTVAESDLRDLCLKVAEPTLQDVRDAAADFARGDKPDEIVSVDDDNDDDEETMGDLIKGDRKYSHLHTHDWFTDRVMTYGEKKNKKKKKKLKSSKSKSKVTICGKSIWNHASQNAMSRDGWFQFSVMAKDCDLKHAIQLCRNWSEFSDLTLLTIWQYFPASNWESWGSNRFTQQLQQLGFFPYFADFEAETNTRHHQVGGRSAGRRQHNMVEARNILVGNMKRNDPVTRRFIQYLLMRAGEVLVMVRDGKTGRVITAPPEEHLWTFRRKAGLGRAVKNDWDNILEMGPDFMKLTDTLREWRFGFNDYYDVYIWDLVPGEDHSEMYNRVVAELRNAWRISHPRQLYNHIEPLLRGLHRNNDTGHTRQIKPGEDVESIWDTMMDERSQIKLFNVVGTKVKEHSDADLEAATYMFYNKANEAEDAVLFPDELTRKNFAFREIANGISDIESGVLPSTARHLTKGLDAINLGKDPYKALRAVKDQEELTIWGLPNVWVTGLVQARKEKPDSKQKHLLQKTGLMGAHKNINFDMRMDTLEPMEMMERDRSFSFKESFHAGDLEPGYNSKYALLQKTLHAMLHTPHSGPTDWVWYIASILDWLDLRGDYEPEDYVLDPTAPWPHSFIVQDLVEAFAMMAMFFPGLEVTKLVTMFVNSSQCEEFRNSGVFDVEDRNKVRPDRRTRTSYKFREKGFWKEWNEFCNEKTSVFWADRYPMEWSLTVRPILAHLYKAGVIAPANVQPHPEVVKGIVTAQTEPHRPGKLDLFINFEDKYGNFSQTFPSSFVPPSQWPEIVPRAKSFAKSHPTARFALLRTWSSPHYYPFMVSPASRHMTSFVDSCNRSWECKFVPKDMPGSEYSAHHTIGKRLELLKHKFGRRVMNRGDLVLVMGEDEDDLFKYCTAVTLAIQTKPWLREIDLWKSFINVDVDFIERMEVHWLE